MRLGMLTSWNTQCGIAEYSRALAESFRERADIELTILGSRNYDERATAEAEDYVVSCFDIEAWNRHGHRALDVETILGLGLDVLHVQYQLTLYNVERLNELLARFEGPKVVTWHDAWVDERLQWRLFDAAFTHRQGVAPGEATVVPLGIRKVAPIVRTFGLGRTREDVVRPICERNGWVFESISSSEAPLGGQPWRPWRELHDWLRGADALVLWYAEDPRAGSSAAARTAIATRRPVVVNDTTWFRDLPQQSGAFYKIKDDPRELESTLREILRTDSLIDRSSTQTVVEAHVSRYRALLDARLEVAPEARPPSAPRRLLARVGARLHALRARPRRPRGRRAARQPPPAEADGPAAPQAPPPPATLAPMSDQVRRAHSGSAREAAGGEAAGGEDRAATARADAAQIRQLADLTQLPISSHRRIEGSLVESLKRNLRRLLYPILDVQSGVNAANARVAAFALDTLDEHSASLERVEAELARLRDGRDG